MQALDDLAPKVAAGVLARAALALEGNANPAAEPVFEWELDLRARLILSLQESLGLKVDDFSPAALDQLGDKLDETADRLDRPNLEAAIRRLSDHGQLPSDRYEIDVIPAMKEQVYRDPAYSAEEERIFQTVRNPDFEQHFGPAQPGADQPFLISLFARFFKGQYPRRNFYLLVAGRRSGEKLTVHQVWRLYPAILKFTPSNDLIGMLRVFAEAYGSEFRLEETGEVAKMIVSTAFPQRTKQIKFTILGKPSDKQVQALTTYFLEPDKETGYIRSSLVVSINVTKYRELLEDMHWREPTLPRTSISKLVS